MESGLKPKSITPVSPSFNINDKSITSLQQVGAGKSPLCRFPNSITTCCQQVGNLTVYGDGTGKRVQWTLGISRHGHLLEKYLAVYATAKTAIYNLGLLLCMCMLTIL